MTSKHSSNHRKPPSEKARPQAIQVTGFELNPNMDGVLIERVIVIDLNFNEKEVKSMLTGLQKWLDTPHKHGPLRVRVTGNV